MRNGRDQATINMHCLRYDMSPNFLFNKQLEKNSQLGQGLFLLCP